MISSRDLFHRFEASADTPRILLRGAPAEPALSGRELRDRVRRTALRLRREGAAPGTRILLAGVGGIDLVTGILAAWSCDAAVLASDPELLPAEVERLRETFSPRVIVHRGRNGLRIGRGGRAAGPSLPAGAAVIKLSSGSTGRPRGIAVSAGQLAGDAQHLIRGMEIDPEDWNISAIPLSHSYGMGSVLMPLVLQGNPIQLAAPLPEVLGRALSIAEPALFPGIPALYDLFGRGEGPSFTPRGLKTCLSAGSLLRASTARAFRRRFGLAVRAFYGSSETGGIAYDASAAGRAAEASEGCVGTPLPGVEVFLEGEEGRVVVRAESVAWGYVGEAGEAANGEFVAGAFRTGDTGRFDAAGRLRLTGRIGALVNVSGRKINPREVEEALLNLKGVRDAAVLGVPDEARGESLLACVVAEGEVTRERLMSFLRERLAAYKLPRRILFLPELPRTERGKVSREVLLRSGLDAVGEATSSPLRRPAGSRRRASRPMRKS